MEILIKEIEIDLDPIDIYSIFSNEKDVVLLDSAKEESIFSKYSFIGLNPYMSFESYGEKAYINKVEAIGNPFDILETVLKEQALVYESEIPFISGCIGYIGYDTGKILEKLPSTAKEDFKIPDMKFIFYDNIIIFDLINNRKYITAVGQCESSQNSINTIIENLQKGKKLGEIEVLNDIKKDNFISNFTKEEYKNAVSRLKDYIVSGDVYIANMTQRFVCESMDNSFNIYRKLRKINPAPFAAYFNYSDFQIISSSPERFIQVNNRDAHTRPIKGTRPRGKTREEDLRNKMELLNSEKDKAELLMVVDLERNDLSKICEINTVKVSELFKLEEYSTVFHLVSTVEGRLRKEVSAVKCMRECFPGGSITGTPKIRAMEIIEELEGIKRNLYTGSMGYFDLRGNSDFNIVIRTIVKKDNKAYFGVGGGITYDSIEEDEYNETLDKAKALMRVL